MNIHNSRFHLLVTALLGSGLVNSALAAKPLALASPDGNVEVMFRLDDEDQPQLEVTHKKTPVAAATLGLALADSTAFDKHLAVVGTNRSSHDETYKVPVGKTSLARNQYNELVVSLKESKAPHRKVDVAFRVFNDGVALRYKLPEQVGLSDFVLTDELTQLTFPDDPMAHFGPLKKYTTAYETYFQSQPVSKIDSKTLIGLPLLLERSNESQPIWMAITEADLTDYAGMYLSRVEGEPGKFAAKLSPLPGRDDEAKALCKTPFKSPWRVLMIADDPGRLLESNLIYNLNEPSKIEDPSWIKPGTTAFTWWNDFVLNDDSVDFEPGVNTATMKYYIDFCAEQGIPYHTLDGWDIAWYGGPIQPDGPTDITTAAPSIDMPEVLRYAKEKGVRLRVWLHWKALKPQIDEAFALYEKWGLEGVMVDFMDRDDQEMVNFYHEMAEKAAKHHLTLTLHGAYKPTGMARTWPNVLTYEGILNQEYNKWKSRQPTGKGGTPPVHNLNAAFIRMLAGSLDYHQGGMRNVLPADYHYRDSAPPVQGTRGHQLATYVVYLNHLPMLADYPSAYRGEPGLDFLVDVPANWDETRVLHTEFGKAIVIARRHGDDWYVGGMVADEARTLDLPLKFLNGSQNYAVDLYLDKPEEGSTALTKSQRTVTSDDKLPVKMPASGGFAARLVPAD